MSVSKISPKASRTDNSSFTSSLGAPEMFLAVNMHLCGSCNCVS